MTRFVIKPRPDRDEYILWGTIADNAVSTVMTRAEMYTALTKLNLVRGLSAEEAEEMLTDADQKNWEGETITVRNLPHTYYDAEVRVADLVQFVKLQERIDWRAIGQIDQILDYDEEVDYR